jgi:photosystem II stability/assembly factor-like uncharacterized protein
MSSNNLSLIIFLWFINLSLCAWESIPVSTSLYSFVSISWINETAAVAAGNSQSGGAIQKTSDQGNTWSGSAIFGSSRIYGVSSIEMDNGMTYVLAPDQSGQIFGSTDAGASWSIYNDLGLTMLDVTIGSNGNAFVTGELNKVYLSSNESSYMNWALIFGYGAANNLVGTNRNFYGISTIDGVHVIAVGARGYIYYSNDAGSIWLKGNSLITDTTTIYSVSQASNTVAMACGDSSYVSITEDGGATWKKLTVFSTIVTSRFHVISMIDEDTAYITGFTTIGSVTTSYIYKTYDRGTTWILDQSIKTGILSLSMYSDKVGAAGAVAGSGIYVIVPGDIASILFIYFYFDLLTKLCLICLIL